MTKTLFCPGKAYTLEDRSCIQWDQSHKAECLTGLARILAIVLSNHCSLPANPNPPTPTRLCTQYLYFYLLTCPLPLPKMFPSSESLFNAWLTFDLLTEAFRKHSAQRSRLSLNSYSISCPHTHCLVPGACLLLYPYFPTSCACLLPPARRTSWRHACNKRVCLFHGTLEKQIPASIL